MPVTKIKKRDGRVVPFDKEKITNAIWKAAQAVGGKDRNEAERLADLVTKIINEKYSDENIPGVEDIQDIVEKVLIEEGHAKTAKAYILYRHRRAVERELAKIMGVRDDLKLPLNSLQVLQRRYLLRNEKGEIIETPSQMFRRVADYIASAERNYGGDDRVVKEYADAFYEIMVNFEFIPNSPTLMNAGTPLGQLSACFVLGVKDDLNDIFDAVKYTALIHKTGGGTGFAFSFLRPKGDRVKATSGVASGPLSFMRVFDVATDVIKQGGKRRGANMGILHVWHPDIEEFITMKQTPGVMENFNISVAVDDKFMRAVEEDGEYELINPRTGEVVRKVKAKSLFELITYSAWKSAEPGVLFIDTINRTNPTPHYPIHSTNPCVAGDVLITTDEGLVRMDAVHNPHGVLTKDGEYCKIRWAGRTGYKDVYSVETAGGYAVKVTGDHRILTSKGWKKAKELRKDDFLVLQKAGKFGKLKMDREMAMVLGWLTGDGTITNDDRCILYFNKKEKKGMLNILKKYLDGLNGNSVKPKQYNNTIRIKYSKKIVKMLEKFGAKKARAEEKEVPESILVADKEAVKHFVSALFSCDGSVQGNRRKGVSIRLASSSEKLLRQVQLLLLQFGILSKIYLKRRKAGRKLMPSSNRKKQKIYNYREQHELIISRRSMFTFMKEIGFCTEEKNKKFEKLKPKNIYEDSAELSRVKGVKYVGKEWVYDLTEPTTHSFSANGIIVHNCGEVPMPDYESCNLGSINLEKFVELDWSKTDWRKKVNWERLRYVVRIATQFLDNVIDLNKYPLPIIEEATKRHRRIGLGVMGFANMLYNMGIRYGSEESFEVAEEVMRFITEEARKMSVELGRARGSFPEFDKSIWKGKYDAMRNATVTSIAPTGTISMIANTSSGIEPAFALAYFKIVMDGTRLYYGNSIFEHALKVRGLYSEELMKKIIDEGSVQNTYLPQDLKDVFVTAYDITPEQHVRMQAAFQKYTDLAVSKTVNMPPEATVEDVKKVYMLAWKTGCKGITIYREGSRGIAVIERVKTIKKHDENGENGNGDGRVVE
ncbi:MAG: ribonucleotide reductase N-terminal alpha domain-containing protein [Candidatus Anstonellales archaeon]